MQKITPTLLSLAILGVVLLGVLRFIDPYVLAPGAYLLRHQDTISLFVVILVGLSMAALGLDWLMQKADPDQKGWRVNVRKFRRYLISIVFIVAGLTIVAWTLNSIFAFY